MKLRLGLSQSQVSGISNVPTPVETSFYLKEKRKRINFVLTSSRGCPLLDFGEVLQLQDFLWLFPTKNTQWTFPLLDMLLAILKGKKETLKVLNRHIKGEPCFQCLHMIKASFRNVLTTSEYLILKVSCTWLTYFMLCENSVVMERYKLDLASRSREQCPDETLLRCFHWILCLYVWLKKVFHCLCCADK